MIDPVTVLQGLGAWKTAVEAMKQSIDLVRTIIPASGAGEAEKRVIETALTTASTNTAVAEVELAQAFGYELCK